MNKNSKRLGIYITLMLLLTAAAVSFRCAACTNDLDYVYGYFNDKTRINVASALIWSCAAVCVTFAAVGQKVSLRPSFSSPATFLPTGIVGAALIFFAVGMLRNFASLRAQGAGAVVKATALLCAVFSLLSIVHFFLNAFLTEGKTELRAYFAIATVLALACYAAYLYFVGGGAINSPNRITDQMAFLFAALFFLYEARISLGREKWRGYAVFGLVAASMCAYSSIPSLILYFFKDRQISISLEESILTFSIFIFILARLILTLTLPDAEKNGRVAVLEAFAEERSRTAEDTERRYDEAYAVQLTITDIIPDGEMPSVTEDEPGEEFILPSVEEPGTVFVALDDEDDGQLVLVPDVFETDGGDAVDAADEDGATDDDGAGEAE